MTAGEVVVGPARGARLAAGLLIMFALNVAFPVMLHRTHALGASLLIAVPAWLTVLWWCRRDAAWLAPPVVMGVTALLLAPGIYFAPKTSDDVWRYVWDGRVQLAGLDPYRFVPLDPALSFLRDPLLFPSDGVTLINRPQVPTIYPPAAQLLFAIVAAATPWEAGALGIKVTMAAAVVVTAGLLARFRSDRPGVALIYGSSPLIMLEAANGGHLDAVVALLICVVVMLGVREHWWQAGLILGLAAAIKLVPLLLLPAFLLRGRWRASVTALGVLAASYVPHVLAVGALVAGFLPGYLHEEGYDGRTRFALLGFLPAELRAPIALAIACAAAVVVLVRSPSAPLPVSCVWLYGLAFCLSTTIYAWYALPLVVLAIMARRPEWLAVWAASYVAFLFDRNLLAQGIGYGAALMTVLTVTAIRARARVEVRLVEASPAA